MEILWTELMKWKETIMNDTNIKQGRSNFWGRLSLWKKILIGMVLGIVAGVILGPDAEILKPIGTLFINAIKMLIVPLVFFSLIVGVTSMKDIRKMGRIAIKTVTIYLGTTAVAITIGLGLGFLFEPRKGLNMVVTDVAALIVAAAF